MNRYDSEAAQRYAQMRAEARTLIDDPIVQDVEERLSEGPTEAVYERVTVTPVEPIAPPPLPWDWQTLRAYVLGEIEKRHGPQVRDTAKEQAIFSDFLKRWGDDAPIIAVAAFEIYDGMWANAPITVTRFKPASDEFFARRILAGEIPGDAA